MNRQSTSSIVTSTVITLAVVTGVCVLGICKVQSRRKKDDKESLTNSTTRSFSQDSVIASPSAILKMIQQRRSIFPKQYTGKAVSRKIIEEMLEAARWAPTHHLTEPWEFVVVESLKERKRLGNFLAESYKDSCVGMKVFSQKKHDKKLENAKRASHVIAIIVTDSKRNPLVEEIESVAMAVQNMFLVATAHGVGTYWSSGGVYEAKHDGGLIKNPKRLKEFLNWTLDDKNRYCLGWVFVGDYFGSDYKRSWPTGRRKPLQEGNRLTWR